MGKKLEHFDGVQLETRNQEETKSMDMVENTTNKGTKPGDFSARNK